MGRILAIDYGAKRVGLAVTDPLKLIANALDTVEEDKVFDYLEDYLSREEVEYFVVGEPFHTDGRPSQSTPKIEAFITKLNKRFPHVPVERQDESNTSREAFQTMINSGIGKKKRRNKALVDKISATLILQDYMEKKNL